MRFWGRVRAQRPLVIGFVCHGDETGRFFRVGEVEAGPISQLQNLHHFGEVDAVDSIGDLVILGVEAGEPPHGRDVFEHERVLVAAEEDVEGRFHVPFVADAEADAFVGAFDGARVFGAVVGADEVHFV